MDFGQPNNVVPETTEPSLVDLRDYGHAIRRRWATVLVVTIIGIVGAIAYSALGHPSYAATSEVQLPQGGQIGSSTTPTPSVLAANMVSEQNVVSSTLVAALAAPVILHTKSLSPRTLNSFVGSLATHLTVVVPTSSNLLQITWKASSPTAARTGADAFATAYLAYKNGQVGANRTSLTSVLNKIVAKIGALTAQYNSGSAASRPLIATRLSVLQIRKKAIATELSGLPTTVGTAIGAPLPTHPSGLSKAALGAVGLLLGLIIGIGMAIVRDLRDHTVRNPSQLEEELGAPVLAIIPTAVAPRAASGRGGRNKPLRPGGRSSSSAPVLLARDPDSPVAECFRALRSTLVAGGLGAARKVVLIACADPADSSSRLAAELAIAIAESGRTVLIVGADVRGSTLPEIFAIPGSSGLTNVLAGANVLASSGIEDGVKNVTKCDGVPLLRFLADQLHVLPSGPPLVRPLSLLDSEAMVALLAEARTAYDVVLLDCPSRELLESIVPLARVVDGVLVFAGAERTEVSVLRGIRQRLGQVRADLLGCILQVPNGRDGVRYGGGPHPDGSARRGGDAGVEEDGGRLRAVPGRDGDQLASAKGLRQGTGN